MSLKEDVKVDRYNLDRDWESHPMLYADYASAWAEAYAEKERAAERIKLAKEALTECYNRLDGQVRADWEACGLVAKPTEPAIKAWVQQQAAYKKKEADLVKRRQELVDAQALEAKLGVALKAMDHRKTVLENLTKLMLGGYYSKPSIDPEVVEAKKSKNSEAQAKHIRRTLRRKKKEA